MTEADARATNIAWILNTLFILAATFLLGVSYGTKRTIQRFQPAIEQMHEGNVDNEKRLLDIQQTCRQLSGGHR